MKGISLETYVSSENYLKITFINISPIIDERNAEARQDKARQGKTRQDKAKQK